MVELDLADFDSIERCCAELDDTMTQPIDVLALNAGILPFHSISENAPRGGEGREEEGTEFVQNARLTVSAFLLIIKVLLHRRRY